MSIDGASLSTLLEEALARVDSARTVEELAVVQREVLGRRSDLAKFNQSLGALAPEERRAVGMTINDTRARLEAAVTERRVTLEAEDRARRLEAERLDLTEVVGRPRRGHLHLVTQARQELEDVFVSMGYSVAEGPEVETDWYNFEALNMPPGHPARSMWDTFTCASAGPSR